MKIVCAYSGGLDTSVMVHWLKEKYDAEIITYTGDLGQGEDLEAIRLKALRTGASDAVVDDLRSHIVGNAILGSNPCTAQTNPDKPAARRPGGRLPLHVRVCVHLSLALS